MIYKINGGKIWTLKVCIFITKSRFYKDPKIRMRYRAYKTLGTIIIYNPMCPPFITEEMCKYIFVIVNPFKLILSNITRSIKSMKSRININNFIVFKL